jgi:hypothetical protein
VCLLAFRKLFLVLCCPRAFSERLQRRLAYELPRATAAAMTFCFLAQLECCRFRPEHPTSLHSISCCEHKYCFGFRVAAPVLFSRHKISWDGAGASRYGTRSNCTTRSRRTTAMERNYGIIKTPDAGTSISAWKACHWEPSTRLNYSLRYVNAPQIRSPPIGRGQFVVSSTGRTTLRSGLLAQIVKPAHQRSLEHAADRHLFCCY